MTEYLVTMNRTKLEIWQIARDKELGYPEDLKILKVGKRIRWGPGKRADPEFGLAKHYYEIMTDKTGTRYALPYVEGAEIPDGTEKSELPEDWYPEVINGL